MEIVKKDEKLGEVEKELKRREAEEDVVRQRFLKAMRANALFQKYIVQEIILRNLDQMTDIRNLPVEHNPTATHRLLIAAKAGRAKLEEIFKEIRG